MNLLDQVKAIPGGVGHIKDWLGSGGQVVDPATAQSRADTCLTCAHNKPGLGITKAVALAIRGQLGVKNKLMLRVNGEKQLHHCGVCGCVLRLQIWQPQEMIVNEIAEGERYPGYCWKTQKA